ncbi:MAG: sugar transferase [Bacteroidetes bacterium]|nr:sugar transferase [Bacteroidota bacterium]
MTENNVILEDRAPTPDTHEKLELAVSARPRTYFIFKRLLDITISVFVILSILSWLMPILAILIKLDSRGPVFFRQKRTGYKRKVFDCFKLRSMHVNPEAHDLQAAIDDPRITRMGKFLRISNLDELPQFINVLLGDMSIVGPRPHMLNDSTRFACLFPGYYSRYIVKPGITGLAQIKGFRGPTPSNRSIFKRLQWDLYYVEHATIGMDIRIILLTGIETIREVLKIRTDKNVISEEPAEF